MRNYDICIIGGGASGLAAAASLSSHFHTVLLEKNGITFSNSRPRFSNDIPYSESFFHTLKFSGDCLYLCNVTALTVSKKLSNGGRAL